MPKRTLAQGQRIISRLFDSLEEPQGFAHKYAQLILDQAVRNAASRPTPQAPMAASALTVANDTIRPSAGGAPAEVGVSAEFGSDLYPQFHRGHNSRGYWLWPSADQVASDEGDRALEETIEAAIRWPV